jgi:heme exporter protein C
MGALNLPIIWYSVQKWGGNHPTVTRAGGGGLHESMRPALLWGLITLTILFPPILLWLRSRLVLLHAALDRLWEEALAKGLVGWDDPGPTEDAVPPTSTTRKE